MSSESHEAIHHGIDSSEIENFRDKVLERPTVRSVKHINDAGQNVDIDAINQN